MKFFLLILIAAAVLLGFSLVDSPGSQAHAGGYGGLGLGFNGGGCYSQGLGFGGGGYYVPRRGLEFGAGRGFYDPRLERQLALEARRREAFFRQQQALQQQALYGRQGLGLGYGQQGLGLGGGGFVPGVDIRTGPLGRVRAIRVR